MTDTDSYLFCRKCFPNEAEIEREPGHNAHLVRVWVSGAQDGGENTFRLNGKTSVSTEYPSFVDRPTSRGSIINILIRGEACEHFWVKQIHFHKGDVSEKEIPIELDRNALWELIENMERS